MGMKIKKKLFLGFLVISTFIGIIGVISIFEFENSVEQLISLDESIKKLNKSQNLLSYAVNIKYYDEVLTQSARNYAFTENEIWKLRYFEIEPLLSQELAIALDLGSIIEKEFFVQVDEANNKLVEMELNAINQVQNGNTDFAISILESKEYWEYKKNYHNSLTKYLESRNLEYTTLMIESTNEVDSSINLALDKTISGKLIIGASVVIVIIGSMIIGFLISKSIVHPIKKLQTISKQIINGNLDIKTEIYSKDEIGELSQSFDYMIEHLKKTTDIEAQLALQQNLRNALDESSIVSIIDPNRIVTHVNDKFCKISNIPKRNSLAVTNP